MSESLSDISLPETVSTDIQEAPPGQKGPFAVQLMHFYIDKAASVKSNADQLGAEIQQRQDKMKLINEVIAHINHLTDDSNNSLNIAEQAELLEKLAIARELGIKIKEGTKFSGSERDRLIENLHLAADNWDKENKSLTQKMEIHIKHLDRILMLIKDTDRKHDQVARSSIAGIKGG